MMIFKIIMTFGLRDGGGESTPNKTKTDVSVSCAPLEVSQK